MLSEFVEMICRACGDLRSLRSFLVPSKLFVLTSIWLLYSRGISNPPDFASHCQIHVAKAAPAQSTSLAPKYHKSSLWLHLALFACPLLHGLKGRPRDLCFPRIPTWWGEKDRKGRHSWTCNIPASLLNWILMTAHPPLVKPGQVFFLFATWEAIASRLLATNSRLWTHRRNPRNLRQSLLTCWICFCSPRQRTWNPDRKLRIYQKTSKNFLRLAKASWESTAQWFTIYWNMFQHVPNLRWNHCRLITWTAWKCLSLSFQLHVLSACWISCIQYIHVWLCGYMIYNTVIVV